MSKAAGAHNKTSMAPKASGQSKPTANTEKTGKVIAGAAATENELDAPYSPPCTRSQRERFERQLKDQKPLPERRRSSRARPGVEGGRSAFTDLGNVARSSAPKKSPLPLEEPDALSLPATPPMLRKPAGVLKRYNEVRKPQQGARFVRNDSPYPKSLLPPSDTSTSDDD
ncbi:uncharacterized protein LOC144130389 [Amblyomma americanum]